MKMKEWISRGWLVAMALTAVLAVACGNDDDAEPGNVLKEDPSAMTGAHNGLWTFSGVAFTIGQSMGVIGEDYSYKGFTTDYSQAIGSMTLSADSIRFDDLASQILMKIFVYEMYKSSYGDTEAWPTYLFTSMGYTPYRSRMTRVGQSDDSVYFMIENHSYSFPAAIDKMRFTVEADLHVSSVCVVNYTTRVIVADFEVEGMRASGLEPGVIANVGSEYEKRFAIPKLIRFTAKF